MATYYKGTIFLKVDIRTLDYSLKLAYFFENTKNIYFFDLPKADSIDFKMIRNFLKDSVPNTSLQEIKNSEVIGELNKLLENKNNDINFRGGFYYLDIIFEIVKGNDNNLYAKELLSGLIFPIYKPNENTTLISYNIEIKRNKTLDSIYSRYFELSVEREFNFNSLDKLGSFVKNISVCDQNELNEYLNIDKKGLFGKLRKKKYLDELTRLYNKNVFKEDFKIV